MYRTAFRNLSFCSRNLFLHRINQNLDHVLPLSLPKNFFSTNNLSNELKLNQPHNTNDPSHAQDVITNEELKKRISKLEEGDTEAIPDIFEGILSRMLAGKPEEAHKELKRELLGEGAESDEEGRESGDDEGHSEDSEFDLDEDEMYGTDKE